MSKVFLRTKYRGFSLIEVIIAVGILGSTVVGLFTGIIDAQLSTTLIGIKNQSLLYADEGLEAARNMRDKSWNSLSAGDYGLVISSGHWELSGTEDTNEFYTRVITIDAISSQKKRVTSSVTWNYAGKTGTVFLETYLTNWKPF